MPEWLENETGLNARISPGICFGTQDQPAALACHLLAETAGMHRNSRGRPEGCPLPRIAEVQALADAMPDRLAAAVLLDARRQPRSAGSPVKRADRPHSRVGHAVGRIRCNCLRNRSILGITDLDLLRGVCM